MKVKLTFEIECGDTTCAAAPGNFCKYWMGDAVGAGKCYFFGRLEDKDGRVQRHPKCLDLANSAQGSA